MIKFKSSSQFLFCTNAHNLSFDKNKDEIYGVFNLIDVFKKFENYSLIISNPSGAYSKEIENKKIQVSNNILIISEPHSFYKVLQFSDAFIRNTSTDGDSISIKESLYLNKLTFCTSVVSRPKNVILYKRGKLEETISNLDKFKKNINNKLDLIKDLEQKVLKNIELYK